MASLTLGRSHWFGAKLPTSVAFTAVGSPKTYHLLLRAENLEGGYGYVFSLEKSTLPFTADKVPTYRSDRSYAVKSTDGGQTFSTMKDSDTGFILAMLEDDHPIGLYDEGEIKNSSGTDVRTAQANETLALGVTVRNIGPATGTLWLDLIEVGGSSVLSQTVTFQQVVPNQDSVNASPSTNAFTMPNTDVLRLDVVVGHYASDTTTRITDDSHRLEIRRVP